MKQPTVLAAGAGYYFKAEAARSEQEGVGTPDYEALFASNEGVKQPTVLAAEAGYHLKAEAARLESLFYVMVALNGTRNYINDFSNISIITRNISTIFSLYRSLPAIYQRFDKGYQFADKSRQYQRPSPLLLSIYYNLIYVKI
ncbi:hypothetical protein [Bacillus cereus]|uniref:hypothetical protein n=2 Tax=Bacillus cereus TaxID=1396 RepID=UPI0003A2729E|nr:hypothetical protein [Bacillus cereus]